MGMSPSFRFLHPPANEECHNRRENADEKEPTPSVCVFEREIERRGQKEPDSPGGLENPRSLRAFVFRPGFRNDGRAGRPFTADAECRQKSIDGEMPPGFR